MSSEKYSPGLLRSILESQGIDTSKPPGLSGGADEESPMERLRRLGVLKKLSLRLSQQRAGDGHAALGDVSEFAQILQVLSDLAGQESVPDTEKSERRRVLHVSAAILRRLLHGSDMDHYRALGLEKGATPEQISRNYHLLRKLFWFDEEIDPQHVSRQRILDAYAALNGSPAGGGAVDTREGEEEHRPASRRTALVLLPIILLFAGVILYRSLGVEDGAKRMADSQPEPDTTEDVIPGPPEEVMEPHTVGDMEGVEMDETGEVMPAGEEKPDETPSPPRPEKQRAGTVEAAIAKRAQQPAALRGEESPPIYRPVIPPPSEKRAVPRPVAGAEKGEDPLLRPDVVQGPDISLAQDVTPVIGTERSLVVIGALDLAVDTLTRKQVRSILLGEEVWIPSVGGALTAVMGREHDRPDSDLYRRVIGKSARQYRIHLAKIRFRGRQLPPQWVQDDAAVKGIVSESRSVIGIIGSSAVDSSVKVLLRY